MLIYHGTQDSANGDHSLPRTRERAEPGRDHGDQAAHITTFPQLIGDAAGDMQESVRHDHPFSSAPHDYISIKTRVLASVKGDGGH
jgi:hypothetical protein